MVNITADTKKFERGMRRAAASMRRFTKATTRAQEQVRAFLGACEPYVHKLRKRRRHKAATSRRQDKDKSAFTALTLRQMHKLHEGVARDYPRYVKWIHHASMRLVFRVVAMRRINEEQSRRFPANYLWPGKRRFQA